jgi:hypothetical protein
MGFGRVSPRRRGGRGKGCFDAAHRRRAVTAWRGGGERAGTGRRGRSRGGVTGRRSSPGTTQATADRRHELSDGSAVPGAAWSGSGRYTSRALPQHGQPI